MKQKEGRESEKKVEETLEEEKEGKMVTLLEVLMDEHEG